MSKILEQIKNLQLKQKKLEYLSYIADLVKNDKKCVDFLEVKEEVISKIEPFLLELSSSIENDIQIKPKVTETTFSEQEVSVLKTVADKVLGKPQTQVNPQEKPISPKKQELSHQDKMSFAMGNRHLANKRVQVINDKNAQIYGNVVGLDAPFVIVKTETGPTIEVPLEKVVPV